MAGGIIAVPAIGTLLSPVLKADHSPKWNAVGPLERFPQGEVTQGFVEIRREDWAETLRTKMVYVWHQPSGELVVYSRSCTDLSCPVTWEPGSACFYCPCHGGIFSMEGEVMAGPPSRPLYRYIHRVVDEVIEVDVNSVPAFA